MFCILGGIRIFMILDANGVLIFEEKSQASDSFIPTFMIAQNGKSEEELAEDISTKLDEEIGNLQEFFLNHNNVALKIKMHWFSAFDNKLADINSGLGNYSFYSIFLKKIQYSNKN